MKNKTFLNWKKNKRPDIQCTETAMLDSHQYLNNLEQITKLKTIVSHFIYA